MADIVVRVKADDQVSRVLDNIKRKADGLQKVSLGKQLMPGGIRAGGQTIAAGIRGDIGGGASTLASFGTSIASAMGGGMGTALTGIFTGVMALKDIGQSMQSTVTEMFDALKDASPMLQGVLKVLKTGFDNVLRPIGDTLAMMLMPAFMTFTMASATAYAGFASAMKDANPNERLGLLQNVMSTQMSNLGILFKNITPVLQDFFDAIEPVITDNLPALIDDVVPLLTEAIKTWLPSILAAIIAGLSEAARALIEGMMLPNPRDTNPPQEAASQLGNWLNDLLGIEHDWFGETMFAGARWPSVSGGPMRYLPGHAAGGIFTTPHIAMIGESGPEAVVPLSRAGGFGGGVVFNITVGNIYGVEDLRREMTSIIDGYAMRSNFRR